jgi:hypothetical protein
MSFSYCNHSNGMHTKTLRLVQGAAQQQAPWRNINSLPASRHPTMLHDNHKILPGDGLKRKQGMQPTAATDTQGLNNTGQ